MTQTQKSKLTKAKILTIAKHVFAQKGFQAATVKDITQAASLGYGTFYLYFKDKKELFYALLEQVEDELYTVAEGGSDLRKNYQQGRNSYRALRKDLRAIFKSFFENRSVLRISKELALIDEDFKKKYSSMKSRLVKRTKQILEKSGVVNMNLNIAAIAIAGMVETTATEWVNEAEDSLIDSALNIEELLPTITKIYFKIVS